MAIEEAIQDIRENVKPVVGGKSLDMAIKALEKQIPKKPISRYYANEGISVCPSCETDTSGRLLMGWEKFCPECGQKIDWEDEDDN